MKYKVTMGPRGTLTIPAKVRKAFGLETDHQLILEETGEGLLLRPTVNIPIEIYTEERIAEFASEDSLVGKIIDGKTCGQGRADSCNCYGRSMQPPCYWRQKAFRAFV